MSGINPLGKILNISPNHSFSLVQNHHQTLIVVKVLVCSLFLPAVAITWRFCFDETVHAVGNNHELKTHRTGCARQSSLRSAHRRQWRRSAQKRDNVLCALLRQRVAQTRREAESREPLPTPPPPKPRPLSNNSTVTHENVRFRDCGTVGRVPNRIFKARKKPQTQHHLYWRSCNVLQ